MNPPTQQPKKLMDYDESKTVKRAEKIPSGLVIPVKNLRNLEYEDVRVRYSNGEEKDKPIITVDGVKYWATYVILKDLKKAAENPNLVRVVIEVSGSGMETRYKVREVEGIRV